MQQPEIHLFCFLHQPQAWLTFHAKYQITELHVGNSDWIADKRLDETRLASEGVVVLGINRPDGEFLGIPDGEAKIRPGDVLITYGRAQNIQKVDQRREGVQANLGHN